MKLVELFMVLEEKINEAEIELKRTSINSPNYKLLLQNINETLVLLKEAETLYKYFSNQRKEDKSVEEELNKLLEKRYSSFSGNTSENINLVIFKSDNCQPCKNLLQITNQIEDLGLNIEYVDMIDQKDHAEKYGIRSFPTLLFLKDGIIKHYEIGYGKDTPEEMVEKYYEVIL